MSILSPGEEEEGEEETIDEEGKGSNLGSTGGWFCLVVGIFSCGVKEVENNHTGKPMVSPRRDKVAI